MTHVSLFSGIGGLDLAAEREGFRTVLQVENDDYCQRVLARHWPEVPRIADIREVTRESVGESVTVLSGGFPCQPFSAAGRRRGTEDDRYLWPEMLRAIRELGPTWVVAENVAGLLSLNGGVEFESVCSDLERAGYEVLPALYPAAGVGAPHRRDRVFVVAHSVLDRQPEGRLPIRSGRPQQAEAIASRSSEDVADATQQLPHGSRDAGQRRRGEPANGGDDVSNAGSRGGAKPSQAGRQARLRAQDADWWQTESNVGGVAHELSAGMDGGGLNTERDEAMEWEGEPNVPRVATGVRNRVDRLRALGNAVVPAQAQPIFRAIREAL